MLVLQIYETESSVARGKCFGSGKNSCTSHNRSIPSNKRFENTTVRGTKKGIASPRRLFRTPLPNIDYQAVTRNRLVKMYQTLLHKSLIISRGRWLSRPHFLYRCPQKHDRSLLRTPLQAVPICLSPNSCICFKFDITQYVISTNPQTTIISCKRNKTLDSVKSYAPPTTAQFPPMRGSRIPRLGAR